MPLLPWDAQARVALLTEQSKRILVVDDNEMNTDLLKRRLERRGFVVVAAQGGKEALRILDQQPIDMVLLDVMMPEMNGSRCCRRFASRGQRPRCP